MPKVYRVMIRRLIFRAPIFMLSASDSFLLSAAVAAIMSIPTYENITWMIVVLVKNISINVTLKVRNNNLPHPEKDPYSAGYGSLEIAVLVFDLIDGIEE